VKLPRPEFKHSPHLLSRLIWMELYLQFPIRLLWRVQA
jgi:hypothetical protein